MKGYKSVGLPRQKTLLKNKEYQCGNRFWDKKKAADKSQSKSTIPINGLGKDKLLAALEKGDST